MVKPDHLNHRTGWNGRRMGFSQDQSLRPGQRTQQSRILPGKGGDDHTAIGTHRQSTAQMIRPAVIGP